MESNTNLEDQADTIIAKIKHYLISSMACLINESSDEEFYRALCYALREEIMINGAATRRTFNRYNARMLYYISMEYLPGQFLNNNISNINASELINRVITKLNRQHDNIFSCEPDPGLGNGGLGRLASCLLDSLATHNYPAMGYGLRYQYGVFEQQLWDGIQVERPDTWLLHENPWEFRRDAHAYSIKFRGESIPQSNLHGEKVLGLHDYEEVRALAYDTSILGYSESHDFSVVTMRLWTTKESPRNFQLQRYNAGQLDQAAENTTLTDVLYPNDNNDMGKRIRLKQEFLLVSASLQDIIKQYLSHYPNFSQFADKIRIQINDTHPTLAIAELIRLLIKEHQLSWLSAKEIALTCISYTNHTIMAEAMEQWNIERLRQLLPRQFAIIEKLNMDLCEEVRKRFPDDEGRIRRMSIIEGGQIRMANLAIYGSHHINGVAELHTEILKNSEFKDFYEMFPNRFVNVTNGITQRRWLLNSNPELAAFITERIGNGWITDFSQIRSLGNYASDEQSQQAFLDIKKRNKQKLIQFIDNSCTIRNSKGKPIESPLMLDPEALFDVHIKRIHEYKRQLLNALHAIMLYHELLNDPESRSVKRLILFSGKAAPGYDTAKKILRLIHCIARKINADLSIKKKLKIVIIENYNVSKAEIIIPAADLSEQISTAGMEASGTGNMKLAINGALTIGTDDGANIEMKQEINEQWWPFSFGASANEIATMRTNASYNPIDIYNTNHAIQMAVDTLRDGTFSTNNDENSTLCSIYDLLLDSSPGDIPDKYFVLKDLPDYYTTHKKVEDLYQDQSKWSEMAIYNIAGMGKFSTDNSISNYARKIWELTAYPIDKSILEDVRSSYRG